MQVKIWFLNHIVLYELSIIKGKKLLYYFLFWSSKSKAEVSTLSNKNPGYSKFLTGSSENLKSIQACLFRDQDEVLYYVYFSQSADNQALCNRHCVCNNESRTRSCFLGAYVQINGNYFLRLNC